MFFVLYGWVIDYIDDICHNRYGSKCISVHVDHGKFMIILEGGISGSYVIESYLYDY